jgi:HEAT repeat protein
MPIEPPAPSVAERSDRDDEDDEGLAVAVWALGSTDPEERSVAILELEPDGPGLRYLLEVLTDDPDQTVIGSLEKLLQHPDADVREAAADAIDFLEE